MCVFADVRTMPVQEHCAGKRCGPCPGVGYGRCVGILHCQCCNIAKTLELAPLFDDETVIGGLPSFAIVY